MAATILTILFDFTAFYRFSSLTPPFDMPDTRPNLLVLMTDQQRYDAQGAAGNPVIRTPHLDRLAAGGTRFAAACSSCPVCGPQRASLHTGRSLCHTGVRRNDDANEHALAADAPIRRLKTYDELLTDRGYHAEYYGKWHAPAARASVYRNRPIGHVGPEPHPDLGIDKHAQYHAYLRERVPDRPARPGERIDRFTGRPYRPDPIDVGFGLDEPNPPTDADGRPRRYSQPDHIGVSTAIPAEHSNTAFWARQTIDALHRLARGDAPFSLTCSFHYPHAPIIPVEPFASAYDPAAMPVPASIADDLDDTPYAAANGRLALPRFRDPELIGCMIARYYALVTEIDHWVGQILDTLDRCGVREHTLVVFLSDHGEMLGEHGLREKNIFLEGSVRVPLIISQPGRLPAGGVIDRPVSLLDVFPTILDLLDCPSPGSDGGSLGPAIQGGAVDALPDFAVAEWDWRGDTEANFMVRTAHAKLITTYSRRSSVPDALYDLAHDPDERHNLAGRVRNDADASALWDGLSDRLLGCLDRVGSPHRAGVADRLAAPDTPRVG
jgi:arylsulfatase A-like enzyme